MNLIDRFKNWKTTIGGSAVGVIGAAVVYKVMADAGCHFEGVNWGAVGTYAFAQIMGIYSTDNGKGVGTPTT